MNKIPKRFIRIWLGQKPIPSLFEKWWQEFKELHPDYDFVTISDSTKIELPKKLEKIYNAGLTYAGQSDILRLVALHNIGGIYVDVDIMPLKSFNPLLESSKTFIGLRSSKSFESAVIGGCKEDQTFKDVLNALPEWFQIHQHNSCSVRTGPTFVSSVWFGKENINHLPIKYFYPFNGFGAPKRDIKLKMFSDKSNFPTEMYAAHFSNHRWGGKVK